MGLGCVVGSMGRNTDTVRCKVRRGGVRGCGGVNGEEQRHWGGAR